MIKTRVLFIALLLAAAGTLGYTVTVVVTTQATAFVNFSSNAPNNAIVTEANYILKCQADNTFSTGAGAFNDVAGAPTWVVPRENGTAVIGLIEAFIETGTFAYRTGALQCLDYLKNRQEADGGWSKWYDETTHVRVDSATSPSEAGSVIMAMYKASKMGWEDSSHQYYASAKLAGGFIMACITNKPGTANGLAGAGKEYTVSYSSAPTDARGAYKWSDWSWVSDNSYAYLGLITLRDWAVSTGDYAFARTCNQFVAGILTGMNTYLKNPSNAVWYRVVDGNGVKIDGYSEKIDALCYYPQKYDIPVTQYAQQNIAQWMVDNLQVTTATTTVHQGYGAFMWVDAGSETVKQRRSQGFSEEAWLALVDIPGQTALDARTRAKNWWLDYNNANDIQTSSAPVSYQLWDVVKGGILDWYDPIANAVAQWWERFIDTSANCILVYRGGYDYTAGIPQTTTTVSPQIAHTPIVSVSPITGVLTATGTITASAPLRAVSMTYYSNAVPAPATVSSAPGGATTYHFSLSASPDLSTATTFYYSLHAVDAAGNEIRAPADGYYAAQVARAAQATFNASGGQLALPGGNAFGGVASISIPLGALDSNQTITFLEVKPEDVGINPPTGKYTLGVDMPVVMYQFLPEGLTFARPATITLLYPDDNNDNIVDGTTIDASQLSILWWNETYQQWDYVGGVVDTIHKTITCPITHFSVYGVGFKGPLTDNDYRPKEKIITPATIDNYNDFANFGGIGIDDSIYIYDVTGRRVRELQQGTSRWDGKDQDGRIVESGIYIYQIKIHGKNKPISGTIVVAK